VRDALTDATLHAGILATMDDPLPRRFYLRVPATGIGIGVETNEDAVEARVAAYFDGFGETGGEPAGGCSIRVVTHPELAEHLCAATRASSTRRGLTIEADGRGALLVEPVAVGARGEKTGGFLVRRSRPECLALLLPSADRVHGLVAVRFVRAVLASHLIRAGRAVFHAASFTCGGAAICLAGDQGQGKSTLLMTALSMGGFDFLANDWTFISTQPGLPRVEGLPIAAGLRVGTVALFPHLSDLLAAPQHYHWENVRERGRPSDAEGKIFVHPVDLAAFFRARVSAVASLRAFLVVRFDAAARKSVLEHLSRTTARRVLEDHRLAAPLTEEDPAWVLLADSQAARSAPDPGAVPDAIVDAVPVFRLVHGPTCRLDAVRTVIAALGLRGEEPSRQRQVGPDAVSENVTPVPAARRARGSGPRPS
jgi:hypothetical protein